jgi:hypothetical protein
MKTLKPKKTKKSSERVNSFDAFMRKIRNIYYTDNNQMERAYNIVYENAS